MSEISYFLPYPAELLIPHRPPMLLIRQLLERKENSALIDAYIDQDCFFIDDEYAILPELYIEIIAQATAAIRGWDALIKSSPPVKGFLVGLNNIEFKGKLNIEETFVIELSKDFEFGEVTIMKGIIRNKDGIVLQGEIKVWEDKSGKAINVI
jgi:3-hydroxyacyl-[acyl-carrier-protein] dehydratase